ncbi:MAG TPA: MBL fold metallo-hydrolase, partial [Flavisolibacter sp.]|nr:MBL fold metallo-hydrolase [Flavisolibacter sp.]
QSRPQGSLLVEIQPFLIITSKDILLLDTGLGFADNNGTMQLYSNLEKEGIKPEQVTKVLMSHLHKDHAGGIGSVKNRSQLSFSNANYYVQKRELDFAFEKGMPSYITEELTGLMNNKDVSFLNEDEGLIDGYINYQVTGAHSPWHQVFWIRDENEIVFFGGDVAPQLQQMRIRYKTKYDFDPEKAMQLRRLWWEQGAKENWKFLFYHDIKTPVFSNTNNT